jgi:hypothetical protein
MRARKARTNISYVNIIVSCREKWKDNGDEWVKSALITNIKMEALEQT